MTAAFISQGELGDTGDRALEQSQEEKTWAGKEEIYKNKQMIDGFIL